MSLFGTEMDLEDKGKEKVEKKKCAPWLELVTKCRGA